jgi:hypothetical protein
LGVLMARYRAGVGRPSLRVLGRLGTPALKFPN